MRLIRLLVALSCLAIGIAVGALNAQPVSLDLGITTFRATLGVQSRGRHAGKVLDLANEMGLVRIAMAKRERGPFGTRRAIGRAQ